MALLVSLILAASACGNEATAPNPVRPGSDFGSGTSSSGSETATIVGVWQAVIVVRVPGDVQTWTTTWQFDADGSCRQTRVTESLAEGFPRTTVLACTWTITGTQLQIAFAGGGTLVMEFSFAGLSPDRLVLDGFEYQRQS